MNRTRARWSGLLWVLPAVVMLCVFVYVPIVETFRLSTVQTSTFAPRPRFVGFDNFATVLADPVFWVALGNNIAYAVTSLLFQVGFALVLAAVLEEYIGRRLRGFLRTIYFIPATISITIAGILFQFIYDPNIGLLNTFLEFIGLGEFQTAWLGNSDTAIWGIIAMSQWGAIGYTALLFVVALQKVPRELYEAAHIDGAGKIRSFFSVTVPMVREMTTLLVILTISGAFLVFNEVMVMTGGGPNNSTQVLGTWLYRNAFIIDDVGYASAIAVIIFILTLSAGIAQLIYSQRRKVEL